MIREAIIQELERQGRTRYSLAQSQNGVHPSTCLSFLYSQRNVSVTTAEVLLAELGLTLTPADELEALRLLLRAVQSMRRRPPSLAKALDRIGPLIELQAKGA